MTTRTEKFDQWIRGSFVRLNTELETLYFDALQSKPTGPDHDSLVASLGADLKQQLLTEGQGHISGLLAEGNTDEGFDAGYDLLGNVGLYMAACRRHELTEPGRESRSPLEAASALAMQLGASLGVVPRFASAHLETHNRAQNGVYKTFTSLPDEVCFIDYNTRAALAYIRASEALLHILPLGVSHPVTADLLSVVTRALEDVIQSNEELYAVLDTDRFFYCVRPYYKPHRVGLHEYRGANAGDFAGINVIDLLLGLCRGDDPYYSQLLVDKFLFMTPDDQQILRDCMRRQSLLDAFLEAMSTHRHEAWYQKNVRLFLSACEAHGKTAVQHHEKLIKKFIETPAETSGLALRSDLTASGPPLPKLLKGLKKLADLRAAVPRDDIPSRCEDLAALRTSLASELTG